MDKTMTIEQVDEFVKRARQQALAMIKGYQAYWFLDYCQIDYNTSPHIGFIDEAIKLHELGIFENTVKLFSMLEQETGYAISDHHETAELLILAKDQPYEFIYPHDPDNFADSLYNTILVGAEVRHNIMQQKYVNIIMDAMVLKDEALAENNQRIDDLVNLINIQLEYDCDMFLLTYANDLPENSKFHSRDEYIKFASDNIQAIVKTIKEGK